MLTKFFSKKRLSLFFFALVLGIIANLFFFMQTASEKLNKQSLSSNKSHIRILALGENETIGQGEDSWPKQLEKILNEKNTGRTFSVIVPEISATNSTLLVNHVEESLDKYNPDIVVAMMGINDAYSPMAVMGASEVQMPNPTANPPAKGIFENLLDKIKEKVRLVAQVVRASANSQEREALLKKALGENPEDENPLINLGAFYVEQGRYTEAEELLKKAEEINPLNEKTHFQLGLLYCFQEKLEESESAFKKALEINPSNPETYVESGRLYKNFRLFDKSEPMFQKALSIDSENMRAYYELGNQYQDQEKIKEAEEMYKKALIINPEVSDANLGLGRLYRKLERFKEAGNALQEVIAQTAEGDHNWVIAYVELGRVYRQSGERDRALEVENKAEKYLKTEENYRRLQKLLQLRGIKLVAVQYPMRSAESLRKALSGKNVVIVDSENISGKGEAENRYGDYFIDRAFGDFGHLTSRATSLLAENLSRAIIN